MKTQSDMKLQSILTAIQAEPLTDESDVAVTGCYISDLLSDVLAHSQPGMLWLTVQTHRNVVSVAATKEIAAVLFTCGRRPETAIVVEAAEEGIVLLTTPLTTYEAAGRLWEAGLRE
jgi:predicted transcriptional regulator